MPKDSYNDRGTAGQRSKRSWSDLSLSSSSSCSTLKDDFDDLQDTQCSSTRRTATAEARSESHAQSRSKTKASSTTTTINRTTEGTTYRIILRLAQELRTQKKLTDRRAAGNKLLSLLADAKVRTKLYREATLSSGRNSSSSPKEAIKALWRVVIMNALYAAESALDGKQKVQLDELMLPYKLLRRSEEPILLTPTTTEAAAAFATNASTSLAATTIPAAKEDRDTLTSTFEPPCHLHNVSNTPTSTVVLSANDIVDLLNFCIKMLNKQPALDVAEMDLLEMMNHLCSQPQYVVHFRLRYEIKNIFSEIKKYLSTPCTSTNYKESRAGGKVAKPEVVQCAAKIFSNLMSQTCTRLGVDMFIFLYPCIKLVADLLRHRQGVESQLSLIHHIYNATTHLLAAHLSHCIPAMEEYGETLLRFARQIFPSLVGTHRDAIIDYFSVHLSVCEEAGKLQGLPTGELGRIGPASLDDKQLNCLLSLIASEKALARLPSNVVSKTKQQHPPRISGRNSASSGNLKENFSSPYFLPLPRRHRRYLELCARFLRYTQSTAVLMAKLELVEDFNDLLVGPMEERSVLFPLPVESRCSKVANLLSNLDSPSLRVTCPWARIIGNHIQSISTHSYSKESSLPDGPQQKSHEQHAEKSLRQSLTPTTTAHSQGIFSEVSSSMLMASSLLVPCLQLICACAEAFPLGECWSTNIGIRNFSNFHSSQTDHVVHVGRTCSATDLAAVVDMVNHVLVSHGNIDGDAGVQIWVLLSLIKLSESSLFAQVQSVELGAKELSDAWKNVWSNLLSQDRRYVSFTRDTKVNSAGELVLYLLQHMVKNYCTSTANHSLIEESKDILWPEPCRFMHVYQHQMWSLPVFEDPTTLKSAAVFELIITFQSVIGISDEGQDKINGIFSNFSSSFGTDLVRIKRNLMERHFRLVCYCLRFVEESIILKCEHVHKHYLAAASLCLSSLLHGPSLSVLNNIGPKFGSICTADDCNFNLGPSDGHSNAPSTIWALWSGFLDVGYCEYMAYDSERSWRSCQGLGPHLSSSSSADLRKIAESIRTRQISSLDRNQYQSFSSQGQLLEFSIQFLRTLLSDVQYQENAVEAKEKSDDELVSVLLRRFKSRAFGLVFLLGSLSTAIPVSIAAEEIDEENASLIVGFLKEFIDFIPSLSIDSSSFCDIATCVLGILRMLSVSAESFHFSLPPVLKDPLASLFQVCVELLNSYGRRFDVGESIITSPLPKRRKVFKDVFSDSSVSDSDNSDFHKSTNNIQSADVKKKKQSNLPNTSNHQLSSCIKTLKTQKSSSMHETIALDSRGFRIIAAILAVLEPSSHCCRIVVDSFLGLSSDDASVRDAVVFDVDPRDVMFLSNLYFHKKSILREVRLKNLQSKGLARSKEYRQNEELSILAICLKFILLGRSLAKSTSNFDFFGFKYVSKMVSTFSSLQDDSEEDDKVDLILDLLHPLGSDSIPKEEIKWAKKLIQDRSDIRASQLCCVSEAFAHVKNRNHRSFDNTYASDFVLISVSDISNHVRRCASRAVATALISYPNQRNIVDTLFHSIPFFLLDRYVDKIDRKFSRWVSERIGSYTDTVSLERTAWEHARISVECTAIETLGVIIGETSDAAIAREHIFSLVTLSLFRPQFQLACYLALRRAAKLKGYPNVSDFLSESMDWLFLRWINESREISSIPFLMCDPDLLEMFSTLGVASVLVVMDSLPVMLPNLDVELLHKKAVQRFLLYNSSYIVPIILISKPDFEPIQDHSETEDYRRKYLLEVVTLLHEKKRGVKLNEFICCHCHCIYAYLFPMINADSFSPDCGIREKGEEAIQYLHSSFSMERNINPQQARSLVLSLLRLWVGKGAVFGPNCDSSLTDASYLNAIKFVASTLSHRSLDATVFEDAGLSVTECLLYVLNLMGNCPVSHRKYKMLTVMSTILDTVAENLTAASAKNMQIDFCIQILLFLISDEDLAEFRLYLLRTLKRFVEHLLQENFFRKHDTIASGVLSRIVVCILEVHIHAQKTFFNFCTVQQDEKTSDAAQSFGLLEKLEGDIDLNYNDGLKIHINSAVKSSEDLSELMESASDFLSFILLEGHPSLNEALHSIYPLPLIEDVAKTELVRGVENKEKSIKGILDCFEERLSQKVTNLDFEDEISRFNIFVECGMKSARSIKRDARLYEAALNRLWTALKHRRKGLLHNTGTSNDMEKIQVLLPLIISLCTKDAPESVRFAASRCLGELGGEDFTLFTSTFLTKPNGIILKVEGEGHEDPLVFFHVGALDRLHYLMMSGCTVTSLVAMETIRSLFSSKAGDSYWMMLKGNKTRASLNALWLCTKGHTIVPSIPEYFIRDLCAKIGICDKAMLQNDWCWSENIWKFKSSYEDWIKDLVCSIIVCYYNNPITASSEFFTTCIGVCAIEYSFAEFLFPGIIFDLLSHGELRGEHAAKKASASARDEVLAESMIGPSDSSVNLRLSQLFNQALLGAETAGDLKSASLLVDTLLFLLHVMKARFLLSEKHKRNPATLSYRVHPNVESAGKKSSVSHLLLRDDSNYNSGFEAPPLWRGVPYGIVLHLEGIEVATACQKAKRFTCGLFFADFFADNSLGGSGGVLERLSRHAFRSKFDSTSPRKMDISGFGEDCTKPDDLLRKSHDKESIIVLRSTLKCCLSALDERDAASGVDAHATSCLFSSTHCAESRVDNNFTERNSCLNNLISLDSKLQAQTTSETSSISTLNVLVAKALQFLGLRHVMEQYAKSLAHDDSSFCLSLECLSTLEKQELEEEMSQNSWRMLLWDDFVGPDQNGVLNSTVCINDGTMQLDRDALSHFTFPGFHDSVKQALVCLSKGHSSAFKSKLEAARLSILQEIDNATGSDSIIRLVGPAMTRFQILNDFELLSYDSSSPTFPDDLISRWGLKGGNSPPVFSNCLETELVYSLREVAIRVVCPHAPAFEHLRNDLLMSHLHRFCSVTRELGHIQNSQQSVDRLSKLVVLQNKFNGLMPSQFSLSLMEVRLQEAKNLFANRDFAGAIRIAKVVVTQLQEENSIVNREEIDRVLCDSLLHLGIWISSHYRIESGKSILENYFCPAVKLADSLYARSKHQTYREQAMKAHLSMAEFLTGIYDSVVTRVKSYEWKLSTAVSQQREIELEKTREMYDDARRRYTEIVSKSAGKKTKKAPPPSTTSKLTTDIQDAEAACHDLFLHLKVLEKEVEGDSKERIAVEDSISRFLLLAVESYEIGLSLNSNSTAEPNGAILKHVFRLVSLWFANESNGDVNSAVKRISKKIPSHLFVPLTYQIFSRLDSTSGTSDCKAKQQQSTFQRALRSVVYNTCVEHPYHTLVQLIALANGNKVGNGVGGRQSVAYLENIGASKVEACKELLQCIQKCAPEYVSSLVDSYSALIDSYIELAMAPTEPLIKDAKHRAKEIPFSAISSGSRVATLDRCLGTAKRKAFAYQPCVLTKPPHIRPGCDYGEGKENPLGSELIDSFHHAFSLTETGLHRPKIVICFGSSGGSYKQLVKGEDDIRQDCIMQQVFSTVNRIFKAAAGKRQSAELQIATYTVVPLSPASGVLEWVEDSLPLGSYLLDGKSAGAHSRYYPMEWSNALCRSHFRDAPSNLKRETYDVVCKHFSPALRFFFLEKFSYCTEAWHNARMRYIRSCAVSCMVGHLLGIGDRHLQNILICEKNGNLIHIDFGIVFEQGKCLSVPETVPFRLTRNIVDAMGPCGTEGTFSHSSEATMKLLRENASILLTILSAVVSDPLYKWSVSPVKARLRQRSDIEGEEESKKIGILGSHNSLQNLMINEDKNDAASRAIAKIEEKLQGYENGTTGECQTVEGQVQLLINAARDPDNLCTLYFGWAPWV